MPLATIEAQRAYQKTWQLNKVRERLAAGLCAQCGKTRGKKPRYCAKCLVRRRNRPKRKATRKRRITAAALQEIGFVGDAHEVFAANYLLEQAQPTKPVYDRICNDTEFCGKPFTTTDPRRRYCTYRCHRRRIERDGRRRKASQR